MFADRRLLYPCCLVACVLLIAACGGGGGDDDGDDVALIEEVLFGGSLDAASDDGTAARPLPATNVCALGACGQTDAAGNWSFRVPETSYQGGAVAFDINGPEVQAQTSVAGLSSSSRDISIEFLATNATSVTAVNVSQDGVPGATPTPTPDPEDSLPLSDDPQERACQILRRTNITITNIVSQIVHEPTEECPEEIDTLLAVGNIHPIAFEYSVTSDVPDIEISPQTETAQQGELIRHDGSYLCTRNESFIATITARVVRYLPDGFPPITAEEAISQCGRDANVGNTEESKQVMVEVR